MISQIKFIGQVRSNLAVRRDKHLGTIFKIEHNNDKNKINMSGQLRGKKRLTSKCSAEVDKK